MGAGTFNVHNSKVNGRENMKSEDNRADLLVIGIVVFMVGNGLVKTINYLLNWIDHLLNAIGNHAMSLATLIWQLTLIIGATGLGIAAIASAVYVICKYIVFIRNVGAIREQLEKELERVDAQLATCSFYYGSFEIQSESLTKQIVQLKDDLNQKIEEIKAEPPKPEAEKLEPQAVVVPNI